MKCKCVKDNSLHFGLNYAFRLQARLSRALWLISILQKAHSAQNNYILKVLTF